jgi:cob(I)alamin adenosyltransferase
MSIITKTGDDGKSRFLGRMVSKGGVEMEAIGALDELQAALTIVKAAITNNQIPSIPNNYQLPITNYQLQNVIQDLGGVMGWLATGQVFNLQPRIFNLEKEVEEVEKKLPRQNKFLIFEKEGAVYLNWARTVCRRAERMLVKYNKKYQDLNPNVLIYINRLSDYLFILAREVEYKS